MKKKLLALATILVLVSGMALASTISFNFDGSFSSSGERGLIFTPSVDGNSVSGVLGEDDQGDQTSGVENAYLRYQTNGTIISQKSISGLGSGDTVSFNHPLKSGVQYRFSVDGGGNSWDYTYTIDDVLPQSSSDFTVDNGYDASNGIDSRAFVFESITFNPNSAPSFDSVSTTPSNWTLNDNVDFSYDVDDDTSVANVTLEVFNSTSGNQLKAETFTYNQQNVSDTQVDWYTPSSPGNYTVYFTARDDQGAETVQTLDKTVAEPSDTTPPSVTIYEPRNGVTYGYDFNISVTANESIVNWTVSLIDNYADPAFTTDVDNASFTPNTTMVDVNPNYGSSKFDFYVYAEDSAGNIGSATRTFTVDSDGPEVTDMQSVPDPIILDDNVSYNVTAEDTYSNVSRICLSELTYGSQTIISHTIGSNHSDCIQTNGANPATVLFEDVFVPDSGNKWLNATFRPYDYFGAGGLDELNIFVEDTRPSFQINDPENITYDNTEIPYQVDFNDDGDNDPNEDAYCEAYNDGTLVRNETVNENQAGTFSGTFTTDYSNKSGFNEGFHVFRVECTEFGVLLNRVTTKRVYYSNKETEPEWTLESPLPDENFTYLNGSGGTSVRFSGSAYAPYNFDQRLRLFDDEFNEVTRQGQNGYLFYNDPSAGSNSSFNFTVNLEADTYRFDHLVLSQVSNTFYHFPQFENFGGQQPDGMEFYVSVMPNPAPYVNQTEFPATIDQGETVGFNFLTSDYTNSLSSYSIEVTNRRGNSVDSKTGFFGSVNESWVNTTDLFKAQTAGEYTIQLNVTDNLGFTSTQNYTVTASEGSPSFTLVSPDGNYGTEGADNVTVKFEYDISLPSPGNVTLLVSRPDDNVSGFVEDGGESLLGFSYTSRSLKFNFSNISYTQVAGQNYKASDEYAWKLRYVSNFSGDVYTSGVNNWRFTSQTREETIDQPGFFSSLVGKIALVVLFIILIVGPVLLKKKLRGEVF